MKAIKIAKLIAFALLIGPASGQAQVIITDFTNTAVGAVTSGNVNNVSGGSSFRLTTANQVLISNLVDTNGNSTGAGLTFVNRTGSTGSAGETYSGSAPAPFVFDTYRDMFFVNENTGLGQANFKFTGLNNSLLYQVTVLSLVNSPGTNANTRLVVGSTTVSADSNGLLSIGNLAPALGEISFSVRNNGAGGAGFYNAFQLTVVPEPSVVALLGVAGLSWVLLRRRRRPAL